MYLKKVHLKNKNRIKYLNLNEDQAMEIRRVQSDDRSGMPRVYQTRRCRIR